jgi:hypothetical protein
LGSGQDKLKEIENLVREKASNSGIPPGVKKNNWNSFNDESCFKTFN